MERPKMIVFDYGHTLVNEAEFSTSRGIAAVMEHAVKNTSGADIDEISELSRRIFAQAEPARENNMEVGQRAMQKFLYEFFEIELELTAVEIEEKFWDGFAPGVAMEAAEELLEFLKKQGIRTGVISNISFSGEAMSRRLNRIFPGNSFEFVMASADYGIRKPDKRLFALAAARAGLSAKEMWYCGDSLFYDIMGAQSAGMHALLYESPLECLYRKEHELVPDREYLHISHWTELIELIKGM